MIVTFLHAAVDFKLACQFNRFFFLLTQVLFLSLIGKILKSSREMEVVQAIYCSVKGADINLIINKDDSNLHLVKVFYCRPQKSLSAFNPPSICLIINLLIRKIIIFDTRTAEVHTQTSIQMVSFVNLLKD